MKLFIAFILLLNTLLLAQVDKLERLKQLQQEGKLNYTYLGDDIYQLTYPDGEIKQLYLGKPKMQVTLDSIPTTTIDTWNVDTMLYHNMYSYWKELPTITGPGYQLIIGDANKNGLSEIYAPTRDYNEPGWMNMQIFEIDTLGNYESKYVYADSIGVLTGLYDIKKEGHLELLTRKLHWTNKFIFFNRDSITGYPTKLDFVFDAYPNQKDDPTFGDFDKNDKTDMVFAFLNPNNPIVICEYDSSLNNFNTIYVYSDSIGIYRRGFAVGDFDMDGMADIVFGATNGDVVALENTGEHTYKKNLVANTGGTNSFMTFSTNDINENGKPEFWVSSTTYNGFNDVLRFSCYESSGDNEYKEINRIDFLNVFPFYASNSFAKDVDNDGKEEIVICFDEHVFIIKFTNPFIRNQFKILFMTRNSTPGGYWGATMNDLNKDGFPELLIYRGKYNDNGDYKECTDIYCPDFLTQIGYENIDANFNYSLGQNFPNPFNPNTHIQYAISSRQFVTIKVLDLLGNEVITLVSEEKQQGNYTIQWNGKDKFNNIVSSGIYFINLKTPYYNKTIKGVMLK